MKIINITRIISLILVISTTIIGLTKDLPIETTKAIMTISINQKLIELMEKLK